MLQSPYPRSTTIKGIRWLSDMNIYASSHGDTWSGTWADDNHVYSTADDCLGINRSNSSNLALFRIKGAPPSHEVELVNPMHLYGTLAYYDGLASWKADGLTSVDGVLYMGVSQHSWAGHFGDFVQRTFEGSIVKSADHGVTWSPKPVSGRGMFPWVSFSTPFFVQFGKDYQDAIDDYVYAVSNDGTWNNGNFMTLRRCPRNRIANLQTTDWEYITALDAGGQPKWERIVSSNFSGWNTMPIFKHRGFTSMTGMQYVPFIKRFILPQWAFVNLDLSYEQSFDHSALMLYEAPNPWGPWSIFHVEERWHKGHYNPSLPAKWFEDGGRAMWLISAGDFTHNNAPDHEYKLCSQKLELLV